MKSRFHRFHKSIRTCLFVVLLALIPSQAQAQNLPSEYIENFTSQIEIQQDTSLKIEESIVFVTTQPRHGIYRTIPYRYTRQGLSYQTEITEIQATDAQGVAYPTQLSRVNGQLQIRIGDPESSFTGLREYRLFYRVNNVLQRFDGYDELYWDVNGEDWQFPLLQTSISVVSPWAAVQEMHCFTGTYGSTQRDCITDLETGTATSITVLNPGENLTVAVKLAQPNQLQWPTAWERLSEQLVANLWVIGVLAPSIAFFLMWWKRGRDWMFLSPDVYKMDSREKQRPVPWLYRHRTPLVYEPIKELTPAEVGAIENEMVEPREIAAEIIDLARQKLLKIVPEEKKGLLGTSLGKSTQYRLRKLREPKPNSLEKHQAYLFTELFRKKDEVTLEELRGSFYTKWEEFTKKVWQSVTQKGYFLENPRTTRQTFLVWAFVVNLILFFFVIWLSGQWVVSFVPFLLFFLQAPVSFLFAAFMPSKSAPGVNILLQARGLRATIQRGAWREKIKEKHLFIEEVFPFAVAFGVVDQLSKEIEQLGEKPPDYVGSTVVASSLSNFSRDFTSQASNNLTYNPNANRASGGSGFSGGSSGGGFGGGGGGSW